MSKDSPIIPIFTRKNSTQNLFQIKLIYDESDADPTNWGIDIAVLVLNALGGPHGNFNLTVNEYHRITLVLFMHYNMNPRKSKLKSKLNLYST